MRSYFGYREERQRVGGQAVPEIRLMSTYRLFPSTDEPATPVDIPELSSPSSRGGGRQWRA